VAGLLVSGGESADTPDGQRLIKAMQHLSEVCACLRSIDSRVGRVQCTLLMTVE
jgi:hypothetical protein